VIPIPVGTIGRIVPSFSDRDPGRNVDQLCDKNNDFYRFQASADFFDPTGFQVGFGRGPSFDLADGFGGSIADESPCLGRRIYQMRANPIRHLVDSKPTLCELDNRTVFFFIACNQLLTV